jgi:hypothetical protein
MAPGRLHASAGSRTGRMGGNRCGYGEGDTLSPSPAPERNLIALGDVPMCRSVVLLTPINVLGYMLLSVLGYMLASVLGYMLASVLGYMLASVLGYVLASMLGYAGSTEKC